MGAGSRDGDPQADRALEIERRAEQRYRELAALLPDYVTVVDREMRYRWVSRVAPGIDREDLLARRARVDEHVAPHDRARVIAAIERVFDTGEPDEYEVEAYGGVGRSASYRTRVVPAAPEDGEPRVLLITTDVTRHKEYEEALRASEQRYASLLRGIPDYVLEIDRERRILFSNRTRPGTASHELTGTRLEARATPESRAEIVAKLEHLFATGEDVRWTADNEGYTASFDARAIRLAPDRAVVVARDVTPEKQVMVRLHASEERLSRALDAGAIAVWEVDLAGRVVEQVGWTTRLTGSATMTGFEEWRSVIEPEDQQRVQAAFLDHVAGRTEQYECEYRMRDPATGELFHVLSRGRVAPRPGGVRVVAGTSVDVTARHAAEAERRALERHVEHAQRLDSIGVLAGGVAHDFNNLLTVISSGAECAKKLVAAGQSATEELDHVIEAATRAAALTRQLLAFGRRSTLDVETVDVTELVRSVAAMAERLLPKTIRIVPELGGEPMLVRGDRHQLAQVVLNLCVNGRDAMPGGGVLTIAVGADERDVVVAVTDTGVGIAERDRGRIFEPFFTTKPVGAGTGLGLAVAHGIVEQHGGSIGVESEVGVGTRMTLRLPRHADVLRPPAARAPAPHGRGETVLVADDEPAVLRMAARTLERAGYRVVEAKDGAAAVETYRRHRHEVDVVLLDVLMPCLDGWKAREQILVLAPGARVVLTSGYSASAIPSDGSRDVPFLPKPYAPDALLRAIRGALDAE